MDSRDLERVAALAGQLGYPSSREEVEARFAGIAESVRDYLCVASTPIWPVAGWMHLHAGRTLESAPQALILGLVVDERVRRQGVGRALVAEGERWARALGLSSLRLGSNVIRAEAHRFYQSLGFRVIKTQHAFEKRL